MNLEEKASTANWEYKKMESRDEVTRDYSVDVKVYY